MQEYKNDRIIVRYDPSICTHSGNCVRTLPGVFDTKKRPWVTVNGAALEDIERTIGLCPSGALSYEVVQATGPKRV